MTPAPPIQTYKHPSVVASVVGDSARFTLNPIVASSFTGLVHARWAIPAAAAGKPIIATTPSSVIPVGVSYERNYVVVWRELAGLKAGETVELSVVIRLPSDVNHDGRVDAVDLAILHGDWGLGGTRSDLDLSGKVDGADQAILLGSWTP